MTLTIFSYPKKQNNLLDYKNLFDELRNLCFPIYKYKQGNCHNIIHYCSMILSSRGIVHKKIWFYAPARLSKDSKICITKPDPNNLAISGNLRWGYHVAIFFEEGKNCYIFDWMINEKEPMTINDWVMSMGLANYKIDIVDSDQYLFYPLDKESNLNVKSSFEYFQYEGECKENNWIPKGLALNETAYTFFQKEKEVLNKENKLSKEYKILVGSIINFEKVIKDYGFNKKVTLKFQDKHIELIEKYRFIYSLNLNKWKNQIEYLNLW